MKIGRGFALWLCGGFPLLFGIYCIYWYVTH